MLSERQRISNRPVERTPVREAIFPILYSQPTVLPCTHKSLRRTFKISNFLFSKESGDFGSIINNQRLLIIGNVEMGVSGVQARLIPEQMSFGIRCVYTVDLPWGEHLTNYTFYLLHLGITLTNCLSSSMTTNASSNCSITQALVVRCWLMLATRY